VRSTAKTNELFDPNGQTSRFEFQKHVTLYQAVKTTLILFLLGILKTPIDPEPTQRPGYMKYNKYYDESVIDEWLAGKRRRKA